MTQQRSIDCLRDKIRSNFEELVNELEVKNVLDYLFQEKVLSDDDVERITFEQTRRDRARRFLKILAICSEEQHLKFIEKLQSEDAQPYLAELILHTEIKETPPNDQESIKSIRRQPMQKWSIDEVFVWLKFIKIEDWIAREFKDQKISGAILANVTEEKIQRFCPNLKFGDRVDIVEKRDAELMVQEETQNSEESGDKKDASRNEFVSATFRNFDCLPDAASAYNLHTTFPPASTTIDNLIEPIHRYVELESSSNTTMMLHSFSVEIVPFVSACLNERTNGTCHFGVNKEGVILGISLSPGCEEFQSRLNELIGTCFSPEQRDIVRNCVRPVRFVRVMSKDAKQEDTNLYVVEVDVVPAFSLCTDEAFFAKAVTRKSSSRQIQLDSGKLFRLRDGKPVPFSDENLINFMKIKSKLAEHRQKRESLNPGLEEDGQDQLNTKLKRLLCQGGNCLDDNIYPVFVLSPFDDTSGEKELNVEFLNFIEKKAVFDFDNAAHDTSVFCKHELNAEVPSDYLVVEQFDQDLKDGNTSIPPMTDSSNAHTWIFCNGFQRTEGQPLDVLNWKLNRRKSFVKAVEYFEEMIPREHAVVAFLVFSRNFEVMLCALEEFCLKFRSNWLVICEDVAVAAELKRQMTKVLKIVQSNEFIQRSVIGMSWNDVNATIMETVRYVPVGDMELPQSSSGKTAMSKRFGFDLADLELLSSNHLSNSPLLDDKKKLEDQRADMERRFYKGEEVDWWNFFFEDQVMKRDVLDKIIEYTENLLTMDMEEDLVEDLISVSIYHLPGSGATTVAKNVLWELKSKFRCAIVKRITAETARQLSRLFSFEETCLNKPKPILVLLDNFDETQVQSLKNSLKLEMKNLEKEFENLPTRPFVLLECIRISAEDKADANNLKSIIFELSHCLSETELKEFKRKYEEMEKTWQEKNRSNPKTLISFNILRQNFSRDYIRRTVQRLVKLITDYAERQVLKYVAFIGAYDPDCHYIPASCFDRMMRRGKNSINSKWLIDSSRSFKALINHDSKSSGMHLIRTRIVHYLLSQEIFKELVSDHATPADVMIEFLFSDLFKGRDAATKELRSIAYSLAIKRVRGNDGRYKSDFSPVIQSVIDDEAQDNKDASNILEKTHELTGHFVVAQHLARFYSYFQDWDSAIRWIEIAIECNPCNPTINVLYNTYGNIFKDQLFRKFNEEVTSAKVKSSIPLVQRAMTLFNKEQYLTNLEKNDPSGLLCEGNTILIFTDALKRIPGMTEVNTLLNDPDFIPDCLKRWSSDEIAFVKSLFKRAEEIVAELETTYQGFVTAGQTTNYDEKIIKVADRLSCCFAGNQELSLLPTNFSAAAVGFKRNRQLSSLGGITLAKILKMYRDGDQSSLQSVYSVATENCKSSETNMRDMQTLIGATLLITIPKALNIEMELFSELKRLSAKLLSMTKMSEPIPTQKETYLFYSLLHWPSSADSKSNVDATAASQLREAVQQWQILAANNDGQYSTQYNRRHYILFFLGAGSGMQRVILFENKKQARLEWFQGIVANEGKHVQFKIMGQQFEIPFTRVQFRQRWLKKIFFTLGFSWSGPVAYDSKVEDPKPWSSQTSEALEYTPRPQQFVNSGFQTRSNHRFRHTYWRQSNPCSRQPGNHGSRFNDRGHAAQDHRYPSRPSNQSQSNGNQMGFMQSRNPNTNNQMERDFWRNRTRPNYGNHKKHPNW